MADGRAGALPYLPGLDGLRGLAIAAVLVFHADPSWLPGGMLGITVFFTLSGFLITGLIVSEVDLTGRLDVRAFWLRRARRLVPASLAAVALIALLARTGGEDVPGRSLVGDAIGALTWTANWRFVASGDSYAELFQDPSPFQHFWSLAVEEQLYLFLPLVAMALLGRRGRRLPLAIVLVGGVLASVAAGALLHEPGSPPGRAYYGTDARIAEPLVGALLALLLVRGGGLRRLSERWSQVLGAAGVLALAGVAWLMVDLSPADDRLHRGGLLVTALAAAVIVTAATQRTVVERVLSFQPLVGLGRISYGVYLFHWPVFLWLRERLVDTDRLTLVTAQVAATLAIAGLSYALLEMPIRLRQRDGAVFAVGWANATVAVVAAVALSATAVSVHASDPGDLGASPDAPVPAPPVTVPAQAAPAAGGPTGAPGLQAQAAGTPAAPAGPAPAPGASTVDVENDPVVQGNNTPDTGPEAPPPTPDADALRIAVIGDSLGHNVAVGMNLWAADRTDAIVYNLAMTSCPMSRGGERRFDSYESFPVNPKCAWWDDPWSERSEKLASFDPDVIVIQASLNELLDRRLPEWNDWRRPGDPSFNQWLLDEYAALFEALRRLTGEETNLLLLNAVCGDFDRHENWRKVDDTEGRVAAMNSSVFPFMVGVDHGDLFDQICPDGQYDEDLWGIEDARYDGIHLSDEAAEELAYRWLGPLVFEISADDSGLIGD